MYYPNTPYHRPRARPWPIRSVQPSLDAHKSTCQSCASFILVKPEKVNEFLIIYMCPTPSVVGHFVGQTITGHPEVLRLVHPHHPHQETGQRLRIEDR